MELSADSASYEALLECKDIDAVYIALPPLLYAESQG
jgi:predicted dehydrogenase